MSDVHSGNFASGETDKLTRDVLRCAIPRALVTGAPGPNHYKYPQVNQCPLFSVNKYAGGTTSGVLLQKQIAAAALCSAAQNLATAKLRQIPGCPINNATRFAQYQPYQPPAPCPVSTINPAIPKALDGPCQNVVGINQTWPPH